MDALASVLSPFANPLLAVYGSDGFKVMVLLHILLALVAYGPLFAYPTFATFAPERLARLHQRVILPAQVLQWVFGMGAAGIGKLKFASNPWLVGSIMAWLGAPAVSFVLVLPALKAGDRARASMATGIVHLLVAVTLILMVFKPGFTDGS
jgi:hypothetical protein